MHIPLSWSQAGILSFSILFDTFDIMYGPILGNLRFAWTDEVPAGTAGIGVGGTT